MIKIHFLHYYSNGITYKANEPQALTNKINIGITLLSETKLPAASKIKCPIYYINDLPPKRGSSSHGGSAGASKNCSPTYPFKNKNTIHFDKNKNR